MVTLRLSDISELVTFQAIENQPHARQFIIDTTTGTHRRNFADPDIVYLSIDNVAGKLAGYFILALERDTASVEFRRIVIDRDERGIGQAAIRQMERYCREELAAKRIWLDVFEDNEVGRHIYSKLGFTHFKTESYQGRTLLFYEKSI